MTMTSTQIKYLVALHSLNRNGVARSADIADYLGVTKPTVHSMLTQLTKLNLIKKEKYSLIELTECGRKAALAYADCFSCINVSLTRQLELPSKALEEGTLAILSCLDSDNLSVQQTEKSCLNN